MELRTRYKQTEIGMLPTDWRVLPLENITEPSAPIRYGIVQIGPDTPDGVPIVPIKFIKEIETAPLHRTAKAIEERFVGSRISGGDVLLSVKGTIGRVGIVPTGFSGNIAREIARLRIRDEFCPQFVAYQLESNQTQRRIRNATVGTTRMEFSIAAVRKFLIGVPRSKVEQQAVAAVLTDIDKLISSLKRLIAKKCDLRQGVLRRLLTGQTRLPGFSAPWRVKRLGELAHLYQPETIAQSAFTSTGYPVYGANGVIGYFSRFNHAEPQIMISCRGNCGSVNKTSGPAWINGNAMVVNIERNKHFVDFDFLYYLLSVTDFSPVVTGTGQPQIVRGPLAELPLSIPEQKEEQTAIARVLLDMDAEIVALEGRLAKIDALKQAMMEALLTGRVRLPIQSNAAPPTREVEHA